ncbi:unnamed protein product [Cylindrotheca closterium]|uniref:Glutaredoxin domain-containing protein n=1 Tax=Cylindrotheca closterium TaxID=2856 RepID=A0AAD2CEQ8_9STRA|nr:unnamed protein product [Cylindrotheca closterium]
MSTAASRSLRLGLRKFAPDTRFGLRNVTSTSFVHVPTNSVLENSSMISSHELRLQKSNQQPKVTYRSFSTSDLSDKISSIVSENKVVVFSKTYCPFCSATKQLFKGMGVDAEVIELDEMANGGAMQAALTKLSGQRTVPNVFINGEHLGGNDDTQAAKRSGKLEAMLK